MTKEEIVKMFSMIEAFWPKSGFDTGNTVQLEWWYKKLMNADGKVIALAISKMTDNERYAPTLATIKEYYSNVLYENLVDAEAGWGQVKKAIRYYGYSRGKEAIESLSDEVGAAVIAMGGWESVCSAPMDEENTIRAQFRQCLNAVNNRTKEKRRTDVQLENRIEVIRNENTPRISENNKHEEVQIRKTECNTSDFESVEEVLKNLGLRK